MMKQAEILLHIAENTYADGDELIVEWRRRQAVMIEHARRILEDEALIEQARVLNLQDKARFAQYMPQEHRPAQQVGQRPELAAGRPIAAVAKLMQEVRDEERQAKDQKAQTGS